MWNKQSFVALWRLQTTKPGSGDLEDTSDLEANSGAMTADTMSACIEKTARRSANGCSPA
jgi:hypothetical protein